MVAMKLDEVELLLLRSLQRASTECHHPKSVVTLRYALLRTRNWNDAIESALCNGGNEEPLVARFYAALCKLACDTPYAAGAGDLRSPAGPRYTECWITSAGDDLLDHLANGDTDSE
jgi:hypothetical protein